MDALLAHMDALDMTAIAHKNVSVKIIVVGTFVDLLIPQRRVYQLYRAAGIGIQKIGSG